MLLDYGADINCIYRTNRNIVMTPLDCALQKGFRSTAKFLQLHGGLPASKLRLSGRKPNALTDQELVTPLNFKVESSATAPIGATTTAHQQQLHTDDPTNNKDVKRFVVYINHSESDENSCDEKQSRRAAHKSRSTCHHHHRHRYRMRTSSCETYAVQKDDDSCSDMCRSKSNIEIRRRRKSRHKRDDSSSYSDDTSSSDECCRHRKRNRHRHKRSIRKAKSKDPHDSSDDCDGSCKRKQKKEKRSVSAAKKDDAAFKHDSKADGEDKSANHEKNDAKHEETVDREQNDGKTTNEVDKKSDEARIKSSALKRPQSARASSAKQRAQQKQEEELSKAGDNADNKMEKISENSVAEKVKIEKSTSDDSKNAFFNNDSESAEAIEITTKADVHVSNEDAVIEANVEQGQIVSKEISELPESEPNQIAAQIENEEAVVSVVQFVGDTEEVPHHVDSTNASQNHTSSASETVDSQDPLKQSEVLPNTNNNTDSETMPAQENPTDLQTFINNKDEPRKSSFTVLASDESIDQADPFSGTEQERPKSFKVLSSLEKDDDIEDEDEEYYSSDDDQQLLDNQNVEKNRFASENKKAYKQSKQYSVDIPNRVLDKTLQQHSKDQDSGFEPSPRAMRTKIPTPKSKYSAAMPRKQTANSSGNGRDENIGSSRQEGRKPGDKNAVNMVTVSQSIQKNIRR